MPDLRPLLAKFEPLLKSSSAEHKTRMLTIHVLYNDMMPPELQSPDHEAVHQAHKHLFDECRIESMVFRVLMGCEWPWGPSDCAQTYDAYAERKFDKQGLSLLWSLEVAMMSYIADKYREARQEDGFVRWSQRALLESAGKADWQNHIRVVQEEGKEVDLNVFLPPSEEMAQHQDS